MSLTVFALFALTGCSEFEFHSAPEVEQVVDPNIVVEPQQLTWGELSTGEVETLTFRIDNIGEAVLTIDDIAMASGESFQIVSEGLQLMLEPGESKWVDVNFTPLAGNNNFGQVLVFSDDPDSPETPVDLLGDGAVPDLVITPSTFDFGEVDIPCTEYVDLMLENVGREDLIIEELAYDSNQGNLTVIHDIVLPLVLAPNETRWVQVEFAADEEGVDFAVLEAYSNEPTGLTTAEQTGNGAYSGQGQDDFVVPVDPPVDILFAVDQSCSMDTEATALANAFGNFISTINGVTSGWQIGVVTLEDGCFNYGVLDEFTPDYQWKFEDAVTQGGHHNLTEALLDLSEKSLSKTGVNQCNDGFLRAGALLHVIVVSDEPEQSGTSWATWVQDMTGYVSAANLLKISAVVDLGGCGTGAGGYVDAANSTGGEVLNICDANWANQVDVLANASLSNLTTYNLTQTPAEQSVEVAIDGVNQASGWHYDAVNNSVVFDDPQFDGGELIEITYDVISDCP